MEPSYAVKSAATTRNRILCLYAIFQSLFIKLLATFVSAVSMTVDGWSNRSMKGFHVATIHWINRVTGKRSAAIIDFFRVPGGDGSAKRVGAYLFDMLMLYGLSQRILCTVSDNANDATASTKELGRLLYLFFRMNILPEAFQMRCYTHALQIGIYSVLQSLIIRFKKALEFLKQFTDRLTLITSSVRITKNVREYFRQACLRILGKTREPPCFPCITRWDSLRFYLSECLKMRRVFTDLSRDVHNVTLPSAEEWDLVAATLDWLKTPEMVSKLMGGSNYATISLLVNINDKLGVYYAANENHSVPEIAAASEICAKVCA